MTPIDGRPGEYCCRRRRCRDCHRHAGSTASAAGGPEESHCAKATCVTCGKKRRRPDDERPKSQYLGVGWTWGGARKCVAERKGKKAWQARVKLRDSRIDTYIGVSRTQKGAAEMRDNFIRRIVRNGFFWKLSKKLRRLNFPTEDELHSEQFTRYVSPRGPPDEGADGDPPDQGLRPDPSPDELQGEHADRVEIECDFDGDVRQLTLRVGESCDLKMLRRRVQQLYPDLAQRWSDQAVKMVLQYALNEEETDLVPLEDEAVWLTVCGNIDRTITLE